LLCPNFFGRFVFAAVVMTVCLVVWGFLYGIVVLPMARWLFPQWCDPVVTKDEGHEEELAEGGGGEP
jgi:hypothetical protein